MRLGGLASNLMQEGFRLLSRNDKLPSGLNQGLRLGHAAFQRDPHATLSGSWFTKRLRLRIW